MSHKGINAVIMRYIFIAGVVIMIAGIVGIFVLAQQVLTQKAVSTDHYRIDAELAQEQIVRLQQLQKSLADNKAEIDKTALIVADSQRYEYQDQVITDITTYAKQYNVDILGFDFDSKPGTAPTATDAGGVKSQQRTTVMVKLDNNIPYTSFLKFLKSIEDNITKMQLTGIALQPNTGNPSLILGPTIELEVYLR